MHAFLKAGTLRGSVAGMPNGFCIDRVIGAMVVIAREDPDSGSSA
jgi:hypothetical protein